MSQSIKMRYPRFIAKPLKFKYFGALLGLFVVYFLLFYYVVENKSDRNNISAVNFKHVVVHLDLKGAPPRLQYLARLLPLFKKLGVTGILMEYEDMFPYEGKLVNLSSRNHYDKIQLKKFLTKVSEAQIEVIPLIQTFGHMEHVLKLEEFRHLREDERYPDSICPSNVESIELLKVILEQVVYFHANITMLQHIHIGCNEVFHLNECQQCRESKTSETGIFIKHVSKLRELIANISPYTTVLIWDDMLRGIKKYQWKKEKVSCLEKLEPVYWSYKPTPDVSHVNLFQYNKTFKNIWIATAFKGADGQHTNFPEIKARFQNHYRWMSFIIDYVFAGEKRRFEYKGIILTGWSRYSHMDALCELLPPSIPSLILNLLLIKKFQEGVHPSDTLMDSDAFFSKYIESDLYHELTCKNFFTDIEELNMITDSCTFENGNLFKLLKQYSVIRTNIESAFEENDLGIPSIEYYGKIKYLNRNNADKIREIFMTYLKNLLEWEKLAASEMSKFYHEDVIEEYVGYKMYSVKKNVRDTLKLLEDYMSTHTWKRRP